MADANDMQTSLGYLQAFALWNGFGALKKISKNANTVCFQPVL
jgi:hypothetical protein